jgi:hypothetical protein
MSLAYSAPPHRGELPPVFLSTQSIMSARGSNNSTPAAGSWSLSNRIIYIPFFLTKGSVVYRFFWLNGTTVGTNVLQMGIFDTAFNRIMASPYVLSAGANVCQFRNPGVTPLTLTSGSDSTDATVYTTASVTLKTGVLYLMGVENSAASAGAVSSIDSATGGYPTFTSRSTTQFNTNANRVSIWSAVPTTDFTGALRINFGATQTGAVWGLSGFYHVDTATNDGIVQNATGTGSSTTPLATLAAFGSADNATYGAFGVGAANAGTPSNFYSELSDNTAATPAQALQTVYRPDNDTTVDETITSAAWGAAAVELKSRGSFYLAPGRYYFALFCNGTTAAVFRTTSSASNIEGVYYETNVNGLSILTGTPVDPAGTVSGIVPVCGIALRSSP